MACFFIAGSAAAQSNGRIFEIVPRAADSVTLTTNNQNIMLWGIKPVEEASVAFKVRARITLENALSNTTVECEEKSRRGGHIYAQCVNNEDTDLALYMLQKGLVTADRAAVYGSVFEDPYLQAERQAEEEGQGIWLRMDDNPALEMVSSGRMMMIFGFVLILALIVAFGALSIIIMRGFQRVTEAQQEYADLVAREQQVRNKERSVIAAMLDAELKANKSKIDAYLVVYEEMLKSINKDKENARYKRMGEIIQRQPALSRSVFDNNTDKLDILGTELSTQLIEFYTQITNSPEYIELDTDTPVADAVKTLDETIKDAAAINTMAQSLIEAFSKRTFAVG